MAHRAFSHSDEETLVDRYLRPMIAGKLDRSACSFMHDVDSYSDHPYDLVRNHNPAPGTGDGDGRVWYFFSPVRYAGSNKNASRCSGGTRRRSRTVGAGGRLGTWHSEGEKKTVERSAGGGGYEVESFSYRETTASGFVKPGWLMVEYGVLEEHGGRNIVLCKVYKSPRGPGSDVHSSSGRKRKADVVVEHLADAPRTPSLRPWKRTREDEEDDTLFADILERDLSDDRAPPVYQQESEHMLTGGDLQQIAPGAAAAAAGIVETSSRGSSGNGDKIEFMDAGVTVDELLASWTASSECSASPTLCIGTDDRIELTDSGVTGDEPMLASWKSSECSTLPSLRTDYNDDNKIELMDAGVTVDELLASSMPGECSGSPCPLTDDDNMMVGGLACPPMDHAYVEELLSAPDQRFDPAFVEEFLSPISRVIDDAGFDAQRLA